MNLKSYVQQHNINVYKIGIRTKKVQVFLRSHKIVKEGTKQVRMGRFDNANQT